MEDEVQLQSLAKRLINIYNACKWSKSKLHLRKKKRITRDKQDTQHFEEYTEVETESSARTVFVYNRNDKKKTEKVSHILRSTVLAQYSEGKQEISNKIADNIQDQYCNDLSVNVCTCKKCCCDPGKYSPKNDAEETRKSFENKKESNSKLIICLKPCEKREASASNKNVAKGCCCPVCAPHNYGSFPPMKKKSSIKMSKPPMTDLESPPTSEQFFSYHSPTSPLPSNLSKATKETSCPATPPNKKCCECSPSPQNASFCCQCDPTKQADDFYYTSACCKCPPTKTSDCCQCPPPTQPKTSDCCQCPPPHPAASFGCQCHCTPPPASLCCCDIGEFSAEGNYCCRSVDTNNPSAVGKDRIIIPTCFFNGGEQRTPSGNLSLAISEEVKNVLLDGNSSERQKYDSSDKQINTSRTPLNKREQSGAILNTHIPVVIPSRSISIPQSIQDCNHQKCQCHKKELYDQMINTSCVVIQSCTPPNKRSATKLSHKKCDGVCCKCQHDEHRVHPQSPVMHSPSPLITPGHHVHPHNSLGHSPSPPLHPGHNVHSPSPRIHSPSPRIHSPSPPMHPEHHVHSPSPRIHSPSPPIHPEHHENSPSPRIHSPSPRIHSPSPPMHLEHHLHSPSPRIHSPSPLMHPEPQMHEEHHVHPPSPKIHSPSPPVYQDHHVHPPNPQTHYPSPPMHEEHHLNSPSPRIHSPSPPMHQEYHLHSPSPRMHSPSPRMHSPTPPMHQEHHLNSPSPPIHQEHHLHSPSPPMHQEHHLHSPSPPMHQEHLLHSPSPRIHSPSPPMHPENHVYPPSPPMHPEHHVHPPVHQEHHVNPPGPIHSHNTLIRNPSNPGHHNYPLSPSVQSPSPPNHHPNPPIPHHNPAMLPAVRDDQILRHPEQNFEPDGPPYNGNVNNSSGEERMLANYSPLPYSSQMYPSYGGHMAHHPLPNQTTPPLYKGMVPPRRMDYTGSLLRSQSTPLCCKHLPKGEGDEKIAGINDDTEAEIYATLQKIELSLRDEADSHSRNMRCIVDQVCRQAGQIKELKVLVTGVVEDKRAPTCKEVEKKIKKLEKRKEKEGELKRVYDLKERERRKKEGKGSVSSVQEIPSNLCCKCAEKKIRPMGCCGKCCAKRCRGCCGRCCKGCCPKCCNCCCAPCEKCCPTCCCGLAKCCDACCSCRCWPRRKKKCQCSK